MSKLRYTFQTFVNKARSVHGDKFEYFEGTFKGVSKPIGLKCNDCGYTWKQEGRDHLKGRGCSSCRKNLKLSVDIVISRSKEMYPNKFNYSLFSEYKNNKGSITLVCNSCGWSTTQRIDDHLNGHGYCRLCDSGASSEAENSLYNWVLDLFPDVQKEVYPNWLKLNGSNHPSQLDILIPSINVAIEYNGVYWHSTEQKYNTYHLDKYKVCLDNGVTLIHVFEFEDISEWKDKLSKYFLDPSRYEVCFENVKRIGQVNDTQCFECYGKSDIVDKELSCASLGES